MILDVAVTQFATPQEH